MGFRGVGFKGLMVSGFWSLLFRVEGSGVRLLRA